jgi:hypothetical protein
MKISLKKPVRQSVASARELAIACRHRAGKITDGAVHLVRRTRQVAPIDPEVEELLERMKFDLRAIHTTAARYLDDGCRQITFEETEDPNTLEGE